jgi:hypothetical protein
MSRSLLLILQFAVLPAPLIGQKASGTLPGEVWMRGAALSSSDARLLAAPRIDADSVLQEQSLSNGTPRFSPKAHRRKDRWCIDAWGAGLGPAVLSWSLVALYREHPGEVIAGVGIGVGVGVPAGALIGAIIGC